jgi:2-alkyl-3-oxoalkanoate reductase
MKIFLAGATGAVGRPLVRQLLDEGHEVVALTRSPEKAKWLRDLRAEAALGNAMDIEWLRPAVLRAKPEVVIDQMTDLPQRQRPHGLGKFYKRQIPLREIGSRALLRAAEESGARRLIAQSVAFLYAPNGSGPRSEADRAWVEAPGVLGKAFAGAAAHDERVVHSTGLEGVVLRYGFFYGPGTTFAPGNGLYEDTRRRRLPLSGDGASFWSFVHVDDAACAAVAALSQGQHGLYNVVDDEPAPMREWLPEYADLIGAKPPRRLPEWLVRVGAGAPMSAFLTRFPPVSNARAKNQLGWSPRFSSWRQGFREGIPGVGEAPKG